MNALRLLAGCNLQLAWLAQAIAALAIGAAAALVLVLARAPGVSGAGFVATFDRALVLHVDMATLVWFLAFSAFLTGSVVRAPASRAEATAWLLSAFGVVTMVVSSLLTTGPALRSNYVPVIDCRFFIAGLLLTLTATVAVQLTHALRALRQLDGAIARPLVWVQLPLLPLLLSLAWSWLGRPAGEPELIQEVVSWGPGHLAQFYFAGLMMLAWLLMADGHGIDLARGRSLVWPFVANALPTLLVLPAHLLYAVDSPEYRKSMTQLMCWFSWVGPVWLLALLRSSLFGRTWSGSTGSPVLAALRGSALLFLAGALLGDVVEADTTMIPAHYHGTIGAITLAFVGVATMRWPPSRVTRLPTAHLWLYGVGFTLVIGGLAAAGLLGASRKTPFPADSQQHLQAFVAAMTLLGAGGLMAVSGTLLFVWRTAGALRRGAPDTTWPPTTLAAWGPIGGRRRALAISALCCVLGGGAFYLAGHWTAARAALDRTLAEIPAIDALSRAADNRRQKVAQYFAQGVAMLQARQYDYAMTAFHSVLKLDPHLVEAHVNLGFAMLGIGEPAAARDFFLGALDLRRDQPNAYYGLAVAYEGLGDLEGALGAMRTYVHLAPADDGHRKKAEAALWEWGTTLEALRQNSPAP